MSIFCLHARPRATCLLLVLASGCNTESVPVAPENSPNVLFITLDTTRADRLGCYGYEPARTPTYDGLAARGVLFDNAYCQVPLTLPSHASMMTGTLPSTNGIRINAGGVLTDSTPTLASAFQARGYRTGAFTSIVVLHEHFGLDQGFDVYENVAGDGARRSTTRERTQRPATETVDQALDWLTEDSDKPFFMWLHLTDPHWPLDPPAPFDELEDPYDGEIAYTDAEVKRIVQWLRSRNELEDTLIVITADHGESLEEHGEREHGIFVYRSTMRVPLIMTAPELLPQGVVVNSGVELVSLMPTILDVLGIETGYDLDGASFVDAWKSPDFPFEPIYGESEHPRRSFGWAGLRALTTERWHYVLAPRPELYDRSADPNELVNVIEAHPDVAKDLEAQLAALRANESPRPTQRASLGTPGIGGLANLGYTGGSVPDESAGVGRDPKDMIGVVNEYIEAVHMASEGDHEAAVVLLEGLVARSPESDSIHRVLGQTYIELQRFEDAQRAFESSLRGNPRDAGNLRGLGDSFFFRNLDEQALAYYQKALAEEPDYAQVHSRMAVLFARRGDMHLAKPHFIRHAELEPNSSNALTNLSNMLMSEGRFEEAVKKLTEVVELDPACIQAHEALWNAMRSSRVSRSEVTALLREAQARVPEDPRLRSKLAWAIATDVNATREEAREAIPLAKALVDKDASNLPALDVLAATYAAAGLYSEAVILAERGLELANTTMPSIAPVFEQRLTLYRAQLPFRE